MKLILSRKGFDSTTGGKCSPIYDSKFISFPIPQADSTIFYKNMSFDNNHNFLKVMKDLNINLYSEAHLDPDLRKSIINIREKCWQPLFGQHGRAQSLLQNCNVSEGDLFLFFGNFKECEYVNGTFRYKSGSKDVSAIYGYLEVERVIDVNQDEVPEWAFYHPHVVLKDDYANQKNVLYVGTEHLSFDSTKSGAGTFKYSKELVLTREGRNKSEWLLPRAFEGEEGKFKINATLTPEENDKLVLTTKGMGMQEIYIGDKEEVLSWAKALIINSQIY